MDDVSRKKQVDPVFTEQKPGHVTDAVYFYYETDPEKNHRLAIICGGKEKCASDFEICRKSYPYFVIKYTLSGHGIFQVDSKIYKLQPGILSGFTPEQNHHYKTDPDDPMEHIFITFTGSEARELMEKSSLIQKGTIQVENPAATKSLMTTMLGKGLEKSEYSQQLCCNYLRIVLLEQASHVSKSAPPTLSLHTYQKCRKYIDENFSTIMSIQQIADKCGVNIRYMSRLFKKFNNMTPHQYITRLKMNRAANLLLDTTQTVRTIGNVLGFKDPYHFSRNFKQVHGLSPQNYRKLHLDISSPDDAG